MTSQRYLKVLLGLLIGTFVCLSIFNWAVDPYLLFHSPLIDGFNRHKTDLYKHSRMSIAHNLWDQAPENLLVGSSRIHFGFDTSEPLPDGNRYFNLGIPGTNIYEMIRYIQHAEARQPAKRLLIGLDMHLFNRYTPLNESFSEDRLAITADNQLNNEFRTTMFRDKFRALITYDALQTSVRTIVKQPLVDKYGVSGFEGRAVSLARDVKKHGTRTAFHRVQHQYPQVWCPSPRQIFELDDANDPRLPLGQFRSLLRHAHENNIDVRLFTTPAHAYLWETMDRIGLWPVFEEWKKALVRINDEEAKRANKAPFPLWDFSGYNRYTTEEVPELNSSELIQWYWEPSHFRPGLGHKMMERIFDAHGQDTSFGILITAENIEQHLADIRSARLQYRKNYAKDIKETEALGLWRGICHLNNSPMPKPFTSDTPQGISIIREDVGQN